MRLPYVSKGGRALVLSSATGGQEVTETGPSNREINPQSTCALFTIIPAEIRNEIYRYIFESWTPLPQTEEELARTPQKPKDKLKPAHPLSFLLTCRRSNIEAKILAFHLHSFSVNTKISFHELTTRTKRLDLSQISAITSITYLIRNIRSGYFYGQERSGLFICDIIRLFPNVSHIGLKHVRKGIFNPDSVFPEGSVTSCSQNVPKWFSNSLDSALDTYGWPVRPNRRSPDDWRVDWPNYHVHETVREQNMEALSGHFCNGNCTATLEKPGKRVIVQLITLWANDTPIIVLNPNTKGRLHVEQTGSPSGLVGLKYDPGEKYWSNKRKRELSQPGRGPLGMNVSLSEVASTLWGSSVPKFLWDLCKPKEVTVLEVAEHLKMSGNRQSSQVIEEVGFGSRGSESVLLDQ